ncbi:Uncharacterized protein HZ326_25990 [Fusarium oxysporum f. sp. albedinis]|nr:Uncharacterized protein HZ326_25990 [Fusarium oxysporum f. sp. albedinis]
MADFVTRFHIIYISGLNTTWKWPKRIYFRRKAHKSTGGTSDLEILVFGKYYNMAGDSRDEESGTGEKEKTTQ